MSRIRGIDIKVQKNILHSRRNGRNDVKKINDEQNDYNKDDVEKDQIKELLYKLPQLHKLFDVHRKIGEGTFSSVYLGSLRQHAQLPDVDKRWFAIKHLVPTSHPARVEQELKCLQDMGGKNHVIGVELCLRNLDTIVFIMPYIPHKKFSEYVADMDSEELRQYMFALLTALRHVHSFGVIHRDVKPSNFLYDRDNRRYLLVDFGLAQRIISGPEEPPRAVLPPPAHNNSYKRAREEDDSAPDVKRLALDLRVDSKPDPSSPVPLKVNMTSEPTKQLPKPLIVKGVSCACSCAGAGGVCAACAARPAPRAPRAGTQGFRPPEVLLKYPHQTTAVDMWACGVVLATILSGRYPFFRASDDVSALAELLDLLGTRALQRTATALGRRIVTSSARRGLCLRKLCARLRSAPMVREDGPPCAHCHSPQSECLCRDDSISAESFSPRRQVAGFPEAAFALAARLLEPAPQRRLSAADALRHPFLTPPPTRPDA